LLAQSNPDFFEGFKAIRNEGWAKDCKPFDALIRKFREDLIGERLNPGAWTEPRLKSDARRLGLEVECRSEGS
jgi:hypothetical protein